MKKLTCEMCGSTDLIKQDGVFVCQTCGCKYSIEEAKKMMVEGTVEVAGTVKVDNTAQIQSFIDLSQSAYKSGNGESAFSYANKALEINPKNPYAWIAKMKSIEYIGTLGNLRLMEVAEAGKNAIAFAEEEEKDTITYEVYFYELTRALDLLKLAMDKLSDTADIKSTYHTFLAVNLLTAGKNTMQADSKIVSIYDNIASEAMSLVLLIPDEALLSFSELITITRQCALQYQYETNELKNRYAIYGTTLLDSAVQSRTMMKEAVEEKARNAERLASEKRAQERASRKEAYWAEHQAEREALESESKSLKEQLDTLNSQLMSLPETTMIKSLEASISDLKSQQNALGLFKGKEKKALQTQIDNLTEQRSDMKEKEIDSAKPIKTNITQLYARLSEIKKELTKDR